MVMIRKYIDRYKNTPVQFKASVWYTFCNILQKGISFIVVPVYVRMLTPAEYGQYSVFQSWRDILIILATLNLYCGVFTKAMVDYEEYRDKYTSCMQSLSTLITLCVAVIYSLNHVFWNKAFEMNTETMMLLFMYFLFYPAFAFWTVRQRIEYRYVRMVLVTVIVSVMTPAVSIFLLYATSLRENAVIWGFLIVQCLAGGYFYIMQFARGRCLYVKEYWIKALKFNIPLIPHYLSLIVLGQADRIMIKHYCGSDKAGIYNLAYQVSLIMNVFVNAINNAMVPWTYQTLKSGKYKSLKKVSAGLCALMALMVAGLMIVAPELIRIIGTSDYMEAVWVVPAVAVSAFFTFCYGMFGTVEFYYSATRFVMAASTTGALLNIALNAVFIPQFGFVAAGYTTMICYFAFMLMHYIFMKRICAKEINGSCIYNTKFMWVMSLTLCVFGGFCMISYDTWMVRYAAVAAMAVIVLLKRKHIAKLLRSMKGEPV